MGIETPPILASAFFGQHCEISVYTDTTQQVTVTPPAWAKYARVHLVGGGGGGGGGDGDSGFYGGGGGGGGGYFCMVIPLWITEAIGETYTFRISVGYGGDVGEEQEPGAAGNETYFTLIDGNGNDCFTLFCAGGSGGQPGDGFGPAPGDGGNGGDGGVNNGDAPAFGGGGGSGAGGNGADGEVNSYNLDLYRGLQSMAIGGGGGGAGGVISFIQPGRGGKCASVNGVVDTNGVNNAWGGVGGSSYFGGGNMNTVGSSPVVKGKYGGGGNGSFGGQFGGAGSDGVVVVEWIG